MEIKGTIYKIGQTQAVSEKFSKREIVIKTDESTPYPQFISLIATQDKTAILDSYKDGDVVELSFNLKGRLYNHPDKGEQFFNSLELWKINKQQQAPNFA